MSRFAAFLCILGFAFSLPQLRTFPLTPEAASDEITSLPGLSSPLPFRQFAGYLDLPNSHKHLFYWFVEARNNPASSPVVLWTNGGPGCSGLIGFLTEHGPFRPLSNLTLELNEYAWNVDASMLYIEQPAGVGFSYSDDTSDYNTGDAQAAADNYQLILQFFKRYPSLLKNDFYISSESYGGHYMPTLAKEIVLNNNGTLKFKGFAVGNPLTNMVENAHGMYDTFYGHSVVAKPTHDEWTAKCSSGDGSETCQNLEQALLAQSGNLDPYAIDYPVCNTQAKFGRSQRLWLLNHIHSKKNNNLKAALKLIPPSDYQPCEMTFVEDYLNSAAVKTAIHANSKIAWSECSSVVNYSQADVATDMVPIYKFLLANYKLKILVFSGDDDAVCGALGTQTWIWGLGKQIKQEWAPWLYNDTEYGSQIGGYLTKFDGYSYATVHGAGHEVPTYRPQPAFELFSMFLTGKVF